jgi:Spy/CpxP family protein refolding chaperone
MKKPILAALAALTLTFAVFTAPQVAQAAPGAHGNHGGGKLKKLSKELELTDSQKAQLRPILMGARQQAQAIKADTALTAEARKAKMHELGRSTRDQMQAILTPEQREKLKAIRQEHHEQNHPKA